MAHSALRAFGLPAIAFGACAASQLITTVPAEAGVYGRYCLQGKTQGYPGECKYATFEECRASSSGRGGNCVISPQAAFRESGYGHFGAYGGYGGF